MFIYWSLPAGIVGFWSFQTTGTCDNGLDCAASGRRRKPKRYSRCIITEMRSRLGRVAVVDCMDMNSVGEILERDAPSPSKARTAKSAQRRTRRVNDSWNSVRCRLTKIHAVRAHSQSVGEFDEIVSAAHQYDALKMLLSDIYLPGRRAIERRDETLTLFTAAFLFGLSGGSDQKEIRQWIA